MNRRILLYMWFLVWVAMALALMWEVSAGSCQIEHNNVRKELVREFSLSNTRAKYDIFHIPYSREFMKKILSDNRLCPLHIEEFSLTWDELRERMTSAKSVARGVKYISEHEKAFAIALDTYGVEPYVIAAIIRIESNFGDPQNLGYPILINRLYHKFFLAFNSKNVRAQKFILHQIAWTLAIAEKYSWDLFDARWKSSRSGAFGIPQFIPESFWRYATDGDGDNVIDLFNHADAIVSVANYLARRGTWDQEDVATHVRAVKSYNPGSKKYLELVLEYRDIVRREHAEQRREHTESPAQS